MLESLRLSSRGWLASTLFFYLVYRQKIYSALHFGVITRQFDLSSVDGTVIFFFHTFSTNWIHYLVGSV